ACGYGDPPSTRVTARGIEIGESISRKGGRQRFDGPAIGIRFPSPVATTLTQINDELCSDQLPRVALRQNSTRGTPMSVHQMLKLAIVGFGLFSAADAKAAITHVTHSLNLRSGPDTTYPPVAIVPAGALIDVLDCGSTWCHVHWA